MPKIKTHQATSKRIKITGRGKLRRLKLKRSHLRRKKSKRALHALRKYHPLDSTDDKRVRRLLGLRQPKSE